MTDQRHQNANHFAFEGPGLSGVVATSSLTGKPTGTITVDGKQSSELMVEPGSPGWIGSTSVETVPDAYSRSVTLILPNVHVRDAGQPFGGLAIIVTHRSSLAGPGLVEGALEGYQVREVSGTASFVHS